MGRLQIGWGTREFSENIPCNLSGQMHMRISEGVLDPLTVTALALSEEGTENSVVLISIDIAAMPFWFIEMVQEEVHKRFPEIPEEAVIINVTHNHSSMDIWMESETTPDGMPYVNGIYCRKVLLEKTMEAVTEAVTTQKAGAMAYGYGYAVVANSRRVTFLEDMSLVAKNDVAPNGTSVMYGRTSRDQFAGYEAGTDHFLNAMFTFDETEKLTGIIVNVPCPSQLSEQFYQLSGDYWNEVRENVRAAFGEDVKVLPQCAAAGDLSPRLLHYLGAEERRMRLKYGMGYDRTNLVPRTKDYFNKIMAQRRDIAGRIIEGLTEIYGWAKKDIQTDVAVRHLRHKFPVHKRLITAEERDWCEKNIKQMEANIPEKGGDAEAYRKALTAYQSVKNRNEKAIKRFESQDTEPDTLETVVHTVRVGDIAFTTTTYELYMDFMHRIQARSPFIQTFVVELCGPGTYLATAKAVQGKGYSASLFCNMVSPEGGQDIVEETLKMLEEMRD